MASCRRIGGLLPILFKDLSKPCLINSTLSSSKCKIWNTQLQTRHFSLTKWKGKETVNLQFTFRDGSKQTVKASVGDSLLDTVIDKNVDIDGFGACEGTLACSTCHLIFTQEQYDSLPEPPTDEELDMLDLAFELEDTSRLGCQISVTKDMEGWEILVPEGVADAREV